MRRFPPASMAQVRVKELGNRGGGLRASGSGGTVGCLVVVCDIDARNGCLIATLVSTAAFRGHLGAVGDVRAFLRHGWSLLPERIK
ncbi:hypothetical protein IMZ48_27105 [Candidatus Bathyarchaeota archaeon]|nr:hypothetical protein [Candidatus Bathyarchaeota archaeon]